MEGCCTLDPGHENECVQHPTKVVCQSLHLLVAERPCYHI